MKIFLYGAGDRNLDGKAIKKITVDSTGQHKHYVNIKYNTKGLWYLTTLVDSNTSTNFDISDAVDNILPAIAQQYDDQVADGKINLLNFLQSQICWTSTVTADM